MWNVCLLPKICEMLVIYIKCKIEPHKKNASVFFGKHKCFLSANSPSGDRRRGLFYEARKQSPSNERLNATELTAIGATAEKWWLHHSSSELITKRRKNCIKLNDHKRSRYRASGFKNTETAPNSPARCNATGSLYKNGASVQSTVYLRISMKLALTRFISVTNRALETESWRCSPYTCAEQVQLFGSFSESRGNKCRILSGVTCFELKLDPC